MTAPQPDTCRAASGKCPAAVRLRVGGQGRLGSGDSLSSPTPAHGPTAARCSPERAGRSSAQKARQTRLGQVLRCGPVLPGGTLGRAPPRSLTPGSSGWQLASLEAAAQEGGELGGLLWHTPPPLSLSSCPGSVSQRREQNVYKPLPLFEAHFRSTRELLPKQSNHSTFNKTKQTSQRY